MCPEHLRISPNNCKKGSDGPRMNEDPWEEGDEKLENGRLKLRRHLTEIRRGKKYRIRFRARQERYKLLKSGG